MFLSFVSSFFLFIVTFLQECLPRTSLTLPSMKVHRREVWEQMPGNRWYFTVNGDECAAPLLINGLVYISAVSY